MTEPRGEPGLGLLEFCSYDKDCIYVRNGDVEHCPGHSPHYDPGKPKAAPEPLDLDALGTQLQAGREAFFSPAPGGITQRWETISHALDAGDALLAEVRRLREEVQRQDEQVQDAYDGWRRTLEGLPQANGEYAHLLACSGDRRQLPGATGCVCRPCGALVRTSGDLREAAQGLLDTLDTEPEEPLATRSIDSADEWRAFSERMARARTALRLALSRKESPK